MSEIDENQIPEHLKHLSQIEPTQEATERAMKHVRDILLSDEGRRMGLAPPSLTGGLKPTLRFLKLAAAAAVLIAAGVVAGRIFGPEPIDVEALRQSLLAEMDNRQQSAFETNCARLKDELEQQVRRELVQFAAQTLAASGTQTQRQLAELIQLIEAARIQDRRNIEAALEHIESQFGSGLAALASRTNDVTRLEQN